MLGDETLLKVTLTVVAEPVVLDFRGISQKPIKQAKKLTVYFSAHSAHRIECNNIHITVNTKVFCFTKIMRKISTDNVRYYKGFGPRQAYLQSCSLFSAQKVNLKDSARKTVEEGQ